MTSIVGVKTSSGIVIAADSQLQYVTSDGEEQRKSRTTKIDTGSHYAMASAGWHDTYFEAFAELMCSEMDLATYLAKISKDCNVSNIPRLVGDIRAHLMEPVKELLSKHPRLNHGTLLDVLRGDEDDPSRTVKKMASKFKDFMEEHFEHPTDYAFSDSVLRELALLNRLRKRRFKEDKDPDKPEDSELILAINQPKLRLYKVEGNGIMREVNGTDDIKYLASGSGKEHIDEYLGQAKYKEDEPVKEAGRIRAHSLRLNQATRLARRAIQYASKYDVYTGIPVHLAVVTPHGVFDHTSQIDELYNQLDARIDRNIAKKHTKKR